MVMAALTIVGCSVTVTIVGVMGDGSEIYRGNAVGLQNGSIMLTGMASGTRCHGNYSYHNFTSSGVGSTGVANIQCQDGRYASIQYMTESSNRGWGAGKAQDGTPFIFTFGMSDKESIAIFERIKKPKEREPTRIKDKPSI